MNYRCKVRTSALKLTVVCLAALMASACSSESPDDGAGVGNGGSGSNTAGAAGEPGGEGGESGQGGAPTVQGGSGSFIEDGGEGGSGACQPTTCEALGKNCGQVADDCGGLLDCGTCADGSSCGIVTANVCTVLEDLCVPALPSDVCAGKECGAEGDGCGGTVSCGTCPDGEACGIGQAFQCGTVLTGDDNNCPALITDCAVAGVECGLTGNGCGGTLNCGTCPDGETCGLGGPGICGAPPTCDPADAADVCVDQCGHVSDNCGGTINCEATEFACPDGESCGGGGIPFQCGSGAGTCQPDEEDEACAGIQCGIASDGCGGSHVCGTCDEGSSCFSGVCQVIDQCVPQDEDDACAGKQCGEAGDGCGGTTYDCGSCGVGETCGLRVAFECGSNQCQPLNRTQACNGKQCGEAFNGCGTAPENTFDCGSCPNGSFCSLFEPFQCGTPEEEPCVPVGDSCEELGYECGLAVNNCGQVFDCSLAGLTCNAFQTCSGAPAECVGSVPVGCTVCEDVPTCAAGSPTRLTGRVITPGRSDADSGNQVGVPNAFVYILRNTSVGSLPAIATGVPAGGESCDRCADQDLGPILASAVTDGTGAFSLSGTIPIDEDFLLVTKVGKFRRAVTHHLAPGAACTTSALATTMPNNPTRLPRTRTDAPAGLTAAVNLPKVAVSTGRIDAMECVLFKMGIAQTEFGNFGSAGRVHVYRGGTASNSQSGARIDGSTPFDQDLYGSLSRLESYDMVVADCEGQSYDSSLSQRGTATTNTTPQSNGDKIRNYVNRGGRMFASHLSFTWLHQNGTQTYAAGTRATTGFGPVATWDTNVNANLETAGVGVISVGRPLASPRIENFTDWMVSEGVTNASTTPAFRFAITDPRSMAQTLGTSSEEFVFRNDGNGRVQQFSFNAPYGAPEEASCGKVAYSGFHVAATAGGTSPFSSATFPGHCTDALANNGVLTNQEKILLYMLFDLGACVGDEPEAPPPCEPAECPNDNSCGTLPDGCGGQLTCGCDGGEACVNNQCIVPGCVPTTCDEENTICSSISDGCGEVLVCDCPVCTPLTQQAACDGVPCGTVSDGCSGTHLCSQCSDSCVPLTACPSQFDCGVISDGCDGTLNCGTCEPGQVCGAGGPNVCGTPACDPIECTDVGAQCGSIGDGCGEAVDCGVCPPGQACVTSGGQPNRCVGCQPRDCGDVGAECGIIGDGCGGTDDCGPCLVGGEICGAVSPNQCDPGPPCDPQTCVEAGAQCGVIGDGCGGQVTCPPCSPGQLCGINTPFQCGPAPACTPQSCDSLGAQCGAIGDGCGNALDCGDCPNGTTCGLGEANKCRVIH
jgi:hypothetical protein